VRILIIHAYSARNLGDGSIVLAMIAEAHRVFGPAAEVKVSATDPESFIQFHGLSAHARVLSQPPLGFWATRLAWLGRNALTIAVLWWGTRSGRRRLARIARGRGLPSATREAIRGYLWADLVIAAGGGYLSDTYRRPLPFWHLEHRCAGAAGVPLFFFSQSVGLTRYRLTRFFIRRVLERCVLFICRDRRSVIHLVSLGSFDSKVELCADAAFLISPPRGVDLQRRERESILGVSVLRWSNYGTDNQRQHAAYLDALQRAIETLLIEHPDLRVRLYSMNSPDKEKRMDDIAAVAELRSRLAGHGFAARCTVAEWTPDPSAFMADVGQCALFVASRMHSAILALDAAVPVAGIAYEEKSYGLFELFNLADYVVDIEAPDAIPELVQRAWASRLELRQSIVDQLPEARRQAARAMELIAAAAADLGQGEGRGSL
jgi:colanic acid/amylovoran biosynthesis protein